MSAILDRIIARTEPFLNRTADLELFLSPFVTEVDKLSRSINGLRFGATVYELGTLTANGTTLLTGVGTLDLTTRFRVGDKVILSGLTTQVLTVTIVTASTLTVTSNVTASTGILFAKYTYFLLNIAKEYGLFPGGWETDTELGLFVSDVYNVLQRRGSYIGVKNEIERLTRSSASVLQTSKTPTQITATASYTASTKTLTNITSLAIGDSITVRGSVRGSNGRYVVYTPGTGQVGTRALRVDQFPVVVSGGVIDVVMREDREQNRLRVKVTNNTGSNTTVTLLFTCTGTASIVSSWGSVVGLQVSGTVNNGASQEFYLQITIPTVNTQFTVTPTIGAGFCTIRLGEAVVVNTRTEFAVNNPWRWTGIINRGLSSKQDETNLTILRDGVPGWHLSLGSPGIVENDDYTIAYPDNIVVVEVAHQNWTNYSETAVKNVANDWLFPKNVDIIIGFV